MRKIQVKQDRPWLKYWPKHIPKSLDYPEVPMFELAETSARRFPDKPAIVYYGKEISYKALWESILRFATFLKQYGIGKGDRVAINLPNTPQFVIAYYGIMRANAIAVSTDPMLSAEGLRELVADSQSKAIVTMAAALPLMEEVKKEACLKTVIAMDFTDYLPAEPALPVLPVMLKTAGTGGKAHSWAEVMSTAVDPPPVLVGPDDPCVIMYTSGTTGERKGALHTHRSMIVNTLRPVYWHHYNPSSVHLSVLPFFHITGMHYCMTAPVFTGGTMVILSRWDREAAIRAVELYRCTHWVNITTMVVDMLSSPDIDKRDLSSLEIFGGGGAAVPKTIGDKLLSMGLQYVEGYGLTEAGSGTHNNPVSRPKLQCLGIPVYDVDSMIVDPQTFEEMPIGKSGELVLRNPALFKEFWNKPEETVKAFVEIGGETWFRTGDLVYMDEEGYHYIVDRIKRLVNRAGLKVWPAAIEGEFYKHPAVKEACIIATPDERVGEEVKACIVLNKEYEGKVTSKEIVDWGKGKFAAYEYPRVVEFLTELPKGNTGKILWRKLQEKEFGQK
jgi:acyl-CoA synthetase (AMP-forming)/AMP-acid ligase II